ncbi:VirB3 family type IV secretion system protein [Thalassobaculum sp.]|uniref:VirB3 family type IV secretion system protein n=1 Tax=Thalassobaculum sp. TaxID=2022740 RepID=UPI0032EF97C5
MDEYRAPILRALVERPRFLGVERELGILILTLTLCLAIGLRELQAGLVGLLLLWGGALLTAYDADLLRILKRMRRQADLYLPQ